MTRTYTDTKQENNTKYNALASTYHFSEFKGAKISDPWRKSALWTFLKILLWLKTSKIDHSKAVGWDKEGGTRGWERWVCSCKCPCPQVNVPFYFTKMPFYSQNCVCYFQISPFCFLELPFCFQEVPLYFSKMLYCFPELPFSFSEVPSFYLLGTSFPRNVFFPCDWNFFL